MAWETRANGKQYFYLSQRINGRVVKEYFGSGFEAQIAAEIVEANKESQCGGRFGDKVRHNVGNALVIRVVEIDAHQQAVARDKE